MGPPVLFYYQLTNFYQNHRRYVNSFFDKQLAGKDVSAGDVSGSTCEPLKAEEGTNKPFYPCGLIANSLFNDTFYSPYLVGGDDENPAYNMSETGIAWDSDKDLFKNISSATALDSVAVPLNWRMRYPNGYTASNPPPNLGTDEHFMVWMRTAGLPTFSKLYMRNDTQKMEKGMYQVDIIHCEWPPRYEAASDAWILIRCPRVPRGCLQGHQVHRSQHKDCHGWQESVPRDSILGRGRNLHPPRRHLHRDALAEAKVSCRACDIRQRITWYWKSC